MKIIEENKTKPKVINIGLERFYQAIVDQDGEVAKVDWRPKCSADEESSQLLNIGVSLRKKIAEANQEAVNKISMVILYG